MDTNLRNESSIRQTLELVQPGNDSLEYLQREGFLLYSRSQRIAKKVLQVYLTKRKNGYR